MGIQRSEVDCKHNMQLFEQVRKHKKLYFYNLFIKYRNKIKMAWS